MIKTKGFNIFDLKVMSVHFMRAFKSNIETFFALCIIYIQVMYGGLISMLIVGIIIFAIMIEEYQGQIYWWKFLYILYLGINLIRKFLIVRSESQ